MRASSTDWPTTAVGAPPDVAAACRGVAFGIDMAGSFPAPGLWTGAGTLLARRASLELVPHTTLERCSAQWGWEPLRRLQVADDGRILSLDQHPQHGYMVQLDGFGSYLIAPDGRRILLAAAAIEPWRWQRLLVAQVLPVAALVQGMELFHASAVAVEGRTLAFTGGSGAGKTTLAAHLMLAGADFVCDDALAVEEVLGEVMAHPGPALMNLRDASAENLSTSQREELGTELGRDEAGARLLVRQKASALPLEAIYILRRREGSDGVVRLSRLFPPSSELLLGAGFATAIRPPARLIRRLHLCAKLAAHTPVFEIEAPRRAPPKAVAEAVLRHAGRSVP